MGADGIDSIVEPIVSTGVFLQLDRIAVIEIEHRLIKGMNAIESRLWFGVNVAGGEPLQLVFRKGIVVAFFVHAIGIAHHVELMAIFLIRSRADRTLATGIPEIRMCQPKGVTDFMNQYGKSLVKYPDAIAAAPTARAARDTAGVTHDDAVVVRGIVAQSTSFFSSMGLHQSEAIDFGILGQIPGGCVWHHDGRCDCPSHR